MILNDVTRPGKLVRSSTQLIQVIIRKTSKRIPGPAARAQDAGCQLRQGPGVALWQSGVAESSDPVQSLQCRAEQAEPPSR